MFAEVYKLLISTDSFHKDGNPHVMVTAIGDTTQNNPVAVEFDYKFVYSREDVYHDVVGFFHTHPSGMNDLSIVDYHTMTQWVRCLGKSLLCLIGCDGKINAWIFYKDAKDQIAYKLVSAQTTNDVNYDIWLEPESSFWNPADFLLNEEFFLAQPMEDDKMSDGEDFIDDIISRLHDVEFKVDNIKTEVNKLNEGISNLIEIIVNDKNK